jgi:acetylornithine/N-succinyldiaminopimelate aminotransferase
MSLKTEQELESQYLMPTFVRKPVEFVRGEGMMLYDENGKAYLDFLAGIGVCCLGHCHPKLTAAITEQAQKLIHVSNYYYIEGRGELGEKLSDMLNETAPADAPAWKTFFANSGAEANECAIKIARLHAKKTGRAGNLIVSLYGSFHGRTLSTLAATAQDWLQEEFRPLPGGFIATEPNDVDALRALFAEKGDQIAGILVEPIQGESGVHPLTDEFMHALREVCDESGALLMCDEVQAGLYRCGTYPFAFQHTDIIPDVVTMAKGIAGGVPMGACSARGELGDTFAPGEHGSTFGGSNLAIAASNATLTAIKEEGIAENVTAVGAYLQEQLATLPHVKEVRGRGLMVGCEFDDSIDAAKLVLDALSLDDALVLNYTNPHTLRFLPPLICSKENVDTAIAGLQKLVAAQA